MKKKVLFIVVFVLVFGCLFVFTGCENYIRQADMVSYNLSLEADSFNDVRQITVINCLQGDVLFQMTGRISIEPDMAENQLEIIVQDGEDSFKKHFIGLSDNVTYVVEDISSAEVDNYNYVLKFNPEMWFPVTVEYAEE